MADCKQSAQRMLPPALDESSVSEAQGSLDWTFTPHYMMMKDGHSRCFVSTARTKPETRQKKMYLVREVDIQPPLLKKEATEQKPHATRQPREIRVREEDLRKCGPNIELLSQFALPCMEPNMIQMKSKNKKCTQKDGKATSKRSSSVPTLGSACEADSAPHLPMLTPSPREGRCKTNHHRSNSCASLFNWNGQDLKDDQHKAAFSNKGDLRSLIWRNALSYRRASRVSGLRTPSSSKVSSPVAPRSDLQRASVTETPSAPFRASIGKSHDLVWSRCMRR